MTNLPKDIWVNPEGYKMAFDEVLAHKEGTLGDIQYTDKAKADAEKLTLSTTIECLDKTRLHLDKRIAELEGVLEQSLYALERAVCFKHPSSSQKDIEEKAIKAAKQALEEKQGE